jgi:hypothetical protein
VLEIDEDAVELSVMDDEEDSVGVWLAELKPLDVDVNEYVPENVNEYIRLLEDEQVTEQEEL